MTALVATFIVWSVIQLTHIRFRNALAAQGEDPSSLPYRAPFYPYAAYAALAASVFLVFFQGYPAFLNPFNAEDFVVNYILLPVFVAFVVFWKLLKRTKWVRLEEMDIWTGRREHEWVVDDAVQPKKMTLLERAKAVLIG